MEAAESQLARVLNALIEQEFPRSRGMETRLDAYLHLEDLLRLEDTEASVRELQRHVPVLLNEMRLDLQLNALSEVQHATLRCLSYFMHHSSLNAVFLDDQTTFFLGEFLRLLFSTQNLSTYKLCVWGLTEQNFPAEKHKFLLQAVEGLVHAVVNPFKSRAIEVQALKGLHLLLVKYPEQLGAGEAALTIYMRPIASRLASTEAATRTQARLVLEEASKHRTKWSYETLTMVQRCAEEFLLPVMRLHMEHSRRKDAVGVWKLTLKLLKSRFVRELGTLNQVLYVPEKCMEDEDAVIRLMSMQAWGDMVEILHDGQNWLLNNALVRFLAWPIKLCLEEEVLLNVIDAAFDSWQKIVNVAVVDFNRYCEIMKQNIEKQQNVPEWKFWFGELVINILAALIKRHIQAKNNAFTDELDRFINFVKQLWEPEEMIPAICTLSPFRSVNRSCTTTKGSSVNGSVREQSHEARSKVLNDKECCLVGSLNGNSVRITSEIVGIAFMLEDIFGAIIYLINISDESCGEKGQEQVSDVVMATWLGVCKRVQVFCTPAGSSLTTGLRFLRLSVDFAFGILNSRSNLVELLDVNAPTKQVKHGRENQSAEMVVASVGFGLEWQLQLLAPLVCSVAPSGDLHTVVLHPKSELFDHITKRIEYLKKLLVPCAIVLETWKCCKNNKLEVDFTIKDNTLPFLVLNLLIEFAIFVDDTNNDHSDRKTFTLAILETVVRKLLESIKANALPCSQGVNAVTQFGQESLYAARNLLTYNAARGKKSLLDELVTISKRLSRHTSKCQQSASLLLDLHQCHKQTGLFGSAASDTASSATLSHTLDAKRRTASVVLQGKSSTSSPYISSAEDTTNLSASPAESSSAFSIKAPLASPHQAEILKTKNDKFFGTHEPVPPVKSQLAPPKLAARHPQRSSIRTPRSIYPDLVGCSEGITLLYRHFPLSFRPFFSFYKIKTIGDLSALPVEKVKTFGLKQPVSTVLRALEEFCGRKKRLTGSPFCDKSGSATTSPAISTPIMRRQSKRPFHLKSASTASLPLTKRDRKRTRRSLMLDEKGGREESEGARCKPKFAGHVTFCLRTGENDQTLITQPGVKSQDQLKPSEKNEAKDKREIYTLKLLEHLQRSVYYVDKLVTEEETIQSEEASLQTSAMSVGRVITNYQEAHDIVSRLTSKLQIVTQTSSMRCRKILDKSGNHA